MQIYFGCREGPKGRKLLWLYLHNYPYHLYLVVLFLSSLQPQPFFIFCDTEDVPPAFLGVYYTCEPHVTGSTLGKKPHPDMCKIKLGRDHYFLLTLPLTRLLIIQTDLIIYLISHDCCHSNIFGNTNIL